MSQAVRAYAARSLVVALLLGSCGRSKPAEQTSRTGSIKPAQALDAAQSSAPAPTPRERSWQEVCATLPEPSFPEADRPTAAEKSALKAGDAKRYYYGIGLEPDYVKARHAAFLELDEKRGDWFAGPTILMMLYANGFGVERDANLATKLACAEEGAPAEQAGRVQHLQNLPTRAKLPPFDFCDDATSGMTMGACETLAGERELPEIERRIAAVAAAWPADQRAALAELRARGQSYWELHAGRELDLSGSDGAGVQAREEVEQLKTFATTLEAFARAPNLDPALTLARADADLNRAYKRALEADHAYTTIDADGIRATERAWLKYRDAWRALGALRYPEIGPERWQAWSSRQRSQELAALAQ